MQDCERKKKSPTTQAAHPISPLFKPRQVLLNSISNMKNNQIQIGTKSKTLISLTNQQRTLLLQSICQFLEQNGFSKSLKYFRKEADVESESWNSCLLNLEEMCFQYLKIRDETKVNDGSIKQRAGEAIKGIKENHGDEVKKAEAKVENVSVDGFDVKKKKKKSQKAGDLPEQTAEDVSLSVPSEPEKKSKDKKKKKKSKDDLQEEKKDSVQMKVDELPAEETLEKPNAEDVSLNVPSEPEKKSKDKKKKKNKDGIQEEKKDRTQVKVDELPVEKTLEKSNAVSEVEKKDKSKSRKRKEDALETTDFDEEKKVSKKRKKSSVEENGTGHGEEAANDDAKRRKTDNLDPKTPNGTANGVLENGETKSQKKDKSRQRNDSAEPRTSANAFRRVKEEEVEFVDEKLQDNSYWAKEGADSGYGAKAQEVLGQVRGRDFRHEKTKKKRGSYRGGQIDLHSHSFKFNYDDDDE